MCIGNSISTVIFLLQRGFINLLSVPNNLTVQVIRCCIVGTSLKKHDGILVRFNIGLEDAQDLIADIEQALIQLS